MSHIDPQVWTRLANERVQGETLWARRAAPEVTDRLVGALDADGKRHLLVLLRTGEAEGRIPRVVGSGLLRGSLLFRTTRRAGTLTLRATTPLDRKHST
jgi:hypothetical protein